MYANLKIKLTLITNKKKIRLKSFSKKSLCQSG
jgi:hypothetical protein